MLSCGPTLSTLPHRQAARNEAMLAGRERDALLRENDKIILYYRRELRAFKWVGVGAKCWENSSVGQIGVGL